MTSFGTPFVRSRPVIPITRCKGRYMDNIFVERLWRSLKYEEVYLNAYASVAEAKAGIGSWLAFYNEERQHQSLRYRTPRQAYEAECPWICGRSAAPIENGINFDPCTGAGACFRAQFACFIPVK